MGRELLYSNGYRSPYLSAAEEIAASQQSQWYPSSVDFKATADASGGGSPITTLQDVIKFLKSKPDGSVDELGIIGHANAKMFGFGGTITKLTTAAAADVFFSAKMTVDSSSIDANAQALADVKVKFSSKGRLVLYGCHAGLDDSLMKKLATALGICVYGFSVEIATGFLTSGSGRTARITERGRVYVDTTGFLAAGMGPDVSTWAKDIHKLTPDKKSDGCPDYQ